LNVDLIYLVTERDKRLIPVNRKTKFRFLYKVENILTRVFQRLYFVQLFNTIERAVVSMLLRLKI